MNVVGSCVIYHHIGNKPAQAISFHITDIEGSVFLGCAETLALRLVYASDKLDIKLPLVPKLPLASLADQTYSVSKKIQGRSAEQPVTSSEPQLSADNQEIINILFCSEVELGSL